MTIHEVEQLSPEWFELRRGRPTASEFGRILTPKMMKLAAAADEYINELIAEIYHPGPLADLAVPASKAMLRGIECEPEARAYYAMHRNVEVKTVGFVTTDDGRFGCSPDGLCEEGSLELKCPSGKVHVGYLLEGVLPADYKGQVHGQLIVTGLPWVDFMSYSPGLPPFLIRVEPDSYTDALREAMELFWKKFQDTLAKIKGM